MSNPMRELAALAGRMAEMERRMFGMVRHGTVAEIDAAAGRLRLNLGESTSGGDFLGPWVPYSQMAGALRAHIPPSVGQQMTLFAPSGDLRQAVAMPMTWSNSTPSPSGAGNENVITFGGAEIRLTADGLTISVGGVSLAITGAGVAFTGGVVSHNGANIGSTHIHGGVLPGPTTTLPPAN